MFNKITDKFVKVCNTNTEQKEWCKYKVGGFIKIAIFSVRLFALLFMVLSITNTTVAFSICDYDITFQMISLVVLTSLLLGINSVNQLSCSLLMRLASKSSEQVTVDNVTVNDIRLFVDKNHIEL